MKDSFDTSGVLITESGLNKSQLGLHASTGLQWLTYIIDEIKLMIDQGMDYKWLK